MKVLKTEIVDALGNVDLFVCSSGFELRSTHLASVLNPSCVSSAIIFHLDDTYKISADNLHLIREKISPLEVYEYPKNNSLKTFDIIYEAFRKYNQDKEAEKLSVVIDVSSFTREILLVVIKILSLERFSNLITTIVYSPIESYSTEENFWMTKGIREIRAIIGYPGLHSPSKKLLLVILNGFEEERTEQIIQCFEPSKLIVGKPHKEGSINDNLNSISCSKFEILKSRYNNLILKEFDFSCTEIDYTIAELNKIIEEFSDYNIVISPLNNKVSTIATAIVGLQHDDVQICYASANQYNIDSKSVISDYFLVYNFNEF